MGNTELDATLVFLDTETTGLALDDDIWEIAAVRRAPDGTETELHLFLEHEPARCAALPEPFRGDHEARFPAMTHNGCWHPSVVNRAQARDRLEALFGIGRPHLVGAVPNFDTERLARLWGADPTWRAPWHYHLIDVENLVVGYLAAKGIAVPLPWDSDALSAAVGVEVSEAARHTAMGDVRWAMALYDKVLAG